MVKYIRQSCMLLDCDTLLVVAGAIALGPPVLIDDATGPRNEFCEDTGRFRTPEEVTARSICGGFVLGVACKTDGIEFMPTPKWEPMGP